jgi:DNA (cytosine-5)-methyltransferase 1
MFTGCGGLDLGVAEALGGARLAWCADPDPHVSLVLAARMPGVPNLGDVGGVDWRAVPPVDVVTAGWPCQDISAAGRRAGLEQGARSGLWRHIPPAIAVLRPSMVVLENVAALRWRGGGLSRVLADLASVGYDCLWTTLRASDAGAAHQRERVFLLAVPASGTGVAAQAARLRYAVLSQARPGPWPRSGMTCHGAVRVLALPAPQAGSRGSPPLLPTPQARDYNRAQLPEVRRAGGHQVNLSDVARELAENWDHDGWGRYAPAIHRWEQILGRPAPFPAEGTRRGSFRLSPVFAEWVIGLCPEGQVTAVPGLPYYAMVRVLGNAVVPRQAAAALRQLAGVAAIRCPPADAGPAAQADDRAA